MRKKTILVILPLALLLALVPLVVLAAGGPWSDNFDSYATGSQMHGQGGWKGWGNNAAAGALTSNAQARSAPNSVDVVGATDLVHEYATSSGQWIYTGWIYVPGNYTGQTYFIMLNTYDDACATCNWSLQFCFDSGTGNVVDDTAGTCTGTGIPYLTDQWVEVRVEIDFDTNFFNAYYNNTLMASDAWSEHVSGGGAVAFGAVDLFANGATSVFWDDLSFLEPVVGEPGLAVSKTPDTQDVTTGGNADFTITITNTGTLTWTDVTAGDAMVPACDNAFTDLAPSDSVSYNCTDVGVAAGYVNTVVVTGTVTGGPTMVVSDTATVTTHDPTSVSLSGFGGDNMNIATGWIVALVGVGLAAGFFVILRRRQQIR
jgi:uncharacterized repeat protein (TIGR01451 family)